MTAPILLSPFLPIPDANQVNNPTHPKTVLATAALGFTPPPTSTPISPSHKESAPIQEKPTTQPESTRLVEVKENEPLPEEVEGWLQKLDQEGDIKLENPITHDGEVLLANSEAQIVKDKIVLPLSQSGVTQNLTYKVTDSARWLAEWCVRLIKMMKDRVKYAPETINQPTKT